MDQLLDHIRIGGPSRFRAFCRALENSGQKGIVTTILEPVAGCTDGPRTSQSYVFDLSSDASKCLDDERRKRIKKNRVVLLEKINCDVNLIAQLRELGVFTESHLRTLQVGAIDIISFSP